MDFILYIVTGSMTYYPGSGTFDWAFCGPSLEEAQSAYESLRDDDVYLIGLTADGYYETIKSR